MFGVVAMSYDDFAIVSPEAMDKLAKEYNKMIKIQKEAKTRIVIEDKELIFAYFEQIEEKLNKVKRQIKKENFPLILDVLKRSLLKLRGVVGECNKNNQVEAFAIEENKNIIELLVELLNKLLLKSESEVIREVIKDLLSIFVLLA